MPSVLCYFRLTLKNTCVCPFLCQDKKESSPLQKALESTMLIKMYTSRVLADALFSNLVCYAQATRLIMSILKLTKLSMQFSILLFNSYLNVLGIRVAKAAAKLITNVYYHQGCRYTLNWKHTDIIIELNFCTLLKHSQLFSSQNISSNTHTVFSRVALLLVFSSVSRNEQ